jgi:RNA polymerase sigma-70 factor (ECF subfamily)
MSDETRFRALFDQSYPTVVRYAYNRGHRGPDAEDLVSATFEVAWRRLADAPDGEDATPWLLAVARNLSRTRPRTHHPQPANPTNLRVRASTAPPPPPPT